LVLFITLVPYSG